MRQEASLPVDALLPEAFHVIPALHLHVNLPASTVPSGAVINKQRMENARLKQERARKEYHAVTNGVVDAVSVL